MRPNRRKSEPKVKGEEKLHQRAENNPKRGDDQEVRGVGIKLLVEPARPPSHSWSAASKRNELREKLVLTQNQQGACFE